MSKIISYAIFGSGTIPTEKMFEFNAYMRGLVWNVKFNRLLFPGWVTHIEVDSKTFSDYDNIFHGLRDMYGCTFAINEQLPLCKAMYTRMKGIYLPHAEYVMCRDADSLTSYREAQAVYAFIESGLDIHCITDNPAHGIPLMGGLSAFKCQPVKEKYPVWQAMTTQVRNLEWPRGMDQTLLNDLFYTPEYKSRMYGHYLQGFKGHGEAIIKNEIENVSLPGVDPKLWETNLCMRHIGSAGVVDLEVLRQLARFDKEIPEFESICKRYPKIFYWHNA